MSCKKKERRNEVKLVEAFVIKQNCGASSLGVVDFNLKAL